MTYDAPNDDFGNEARVAPDLVSDEPEWRRPSSLVRQQSKPFRMVASRWWTDGVAPIEVGVVITEPYHTIAIALSRSHFRLAVSGQTIHDGKVGAGALQISGPGQDTRATLRAGCEFLHLHISHAFLRECSEQSGGRGSMRPVDLVDPRFAHDTVIEHLGRSLLRAEALVGNLGPLYAEGIAVAVVSRLLARHSTHAVCQQAAKVAVLPTWRLRRVIEFIEGHLSEPLTLANIAAASGLSRMHFAAQFRASTGLKPHDYLLRRRIERAQAMIVQGDLPLVHVALEVGFQTQSHFNCVFNRIVGEPPGVWRRANRCDRRAVVKREPIGARQGLKPEGSLRWHYETKARRDPMESGYAR